jgi:hypothetical protein
MACLPLLLTIGGCRDEAGAKGTEREVVEVDLSMPLPIIREDTTVDDAHASISLAGTSDDPTSHGGTTGKSAPPVVGACTALDGPGEPPVSSRSGSSDTTGCMAAGGPTAAVDAGVVEAAVARGEVEADGDLGPSAAATAADAGDTETSVAKGEVEADGVPVNMASFPPGENDAAASTKDGETVGEAAATPDDRLGLADRPAFPGGTTLTNTGSGRVLPCMNVRTREGCEVREVDWEGVEAIRCGECTRARSTNSFPLGVVGELLYGVRARVTPVDGAAAFP